MNRKAIVLIVLVFVIIPLVFLISSVFVSFMFVPYDGGGGGGGSITTLDAIGTPTLNPISPEVDYDGSIKLTWSLTSPYTIDGYQIWSTYPYGWNLRYNLGNVHQFTILCEAEGIWSFKVSALTTISGVQYRSPYSNIQSVQISFQDANIPILKTITSPNTDGTIHLDWNTGEALYGFLSGYNIYRFSVSEGWKNIGTTNSGVTEYTDYINENGEYRYYITSITVFYLKMIESEPSNIQIVLVQISESENEPEGDPPTHPSILINNGATITNSTIVTLTLSVINGDEMCFHKFLPEDGWTEWEPYSETKKITLPLDSLEYPDYRIAVKFRNEYDETDDVFADITLELPQEPPVPPEPPDNPVSSNFDNIILYTLIGTTIFCVSLIIVYIYFKKVRTRGV